MQFRCDLTYAIVLQITYVYIYINISYTVFIYIYQYKYMQYLYGNKKHNAYIIYTTKM